MNLQQNSSFINRTRFSLLCEKSGAIFLMLVGLMAGQQSDEILVDFKNFQISLLIVLLGFSWSLMKVQFVYSVTNVKSIL